MLCPDAVQLIFEFFYTPSNKPSVLGTSEGYTSLCPASAVSFRYWVGSVIVRVDLAVGESGVDVIQHGVDVALD